MNYAQESLKKHQQKGGKLEIKSKFPLKNKTDLSITYTPGVAQPCLEIAKNPQAAYKYTIKKNSVAVVTNGTAVLGLGNIGAQAALPVMEGKAVLFKHFGDVDAYPICIDSLDKEEIIRTVKLIASGFGGINLEDIKAPECFEIEERLDKELDIPVFHDDQHGTAIVTLAALINALKVVKKKINQVKILVNGAGAAGIAVTKLLLAYGAKNMVLIDSVGAIYQGRAGLNSSKKEIAQLTNKNKEKGRLEDVIKGTDVFIGISVANVLKRRWAAQMNKNSIIFAMANPNPEILPAEAKKAGAKVIATGRSDYPNQINNVLAFPGVFRGLLDSGAKRVTNEMKIAAAEGLAAFVKKPTANKIIPGPFEKGVADKIAQSIIKIAQSQ